MMFLSIAFTLACTQVARLEDGALELHVLEADGDRIEVPPTEIELDLAAGTVRIAVEGSEAVEAELVGWDRDLWPEGCHTNTSRTIMEAADIALHELTLAGIAFAAPLLLAPCGEPGRVVLREGAPEGLSACPTGEACAWFR